MQNNNKSQLENNFEYCFNFLIKNNYKEAYNLFLENYLKYPDNDIYLLGVVISLTLDYKILEAKEFLNKELKISSLKIIKLLINFLNKNNFDPNKIKSFLFNIGLFLKKNKMHDESYLFFRICLVLEPDDRKSLLLLGEYEIQKKNINKGMNFVIKSFEK